MSVETAVMLSLNCPLVSKSGRAINFKLLVGFRRTVKRDGFSNAKKGLHMHGVDDITFDYIVVENTKLDPKEMTNQ